MRISFAGVRPWPAGSRRSSRCSSRARYSKLVSGAYRWAVRRTQLGRPCLLRDPQRHELPCGRRTRAGPRSSQVDPGEIRVGAWTPPHTRLPVGCCVFASPDAALLDLLGPRSRARPRRAAPGHSRAARARGAARAAARARSPLARPPCVLLIKTLRSSAGIAASLGLLRGPSHARLSQRIGCCRAPQNPRSASGHIPAGRARLETARSWGPSSVHS
jgi:hypothetical protein